MAHTFDNATRNSACDPEFSKGAITSAYYYTRILVKDESKFIYENISYTCIRK